MPSVQFTYALKRFFPELKKTQVDATTIAEVVGELEDHYPGLPDYIVEENGALRKHVNIFVGNEMIADRKKLSDRIGDDDEVFVMQALSGG